MALPLLEPGRPILDAGSGVGIPGLPLALTGPARPVYLVEPRSACIGLIHWLLSGLPRLNARTVPRRIQSLRLHDLPRVQVVTRAALDWPALEATAYPDDGPVLRWSGPDVDPPPTTPDWVSTRITVHWKGLDQEFLWWGPEEVFHVKHSYWKEQPLTIQTA